MSMRTLRLIASSVAILAVGCRNPLDPKADVRIESFGGRATFLQTDNSIINQYYPTSVQFASYGTVAAILTSYTVVYRQVGPQNDPACTQGPGQPICALGGAAGRRYAMRTHLAPRTNDATRNVPTTVTIHILTSELLKYIVEHGDTVNGGLDLDLTFFGTDHNGHDLTVTGTFHIEVFN